MTTATMYRTEEYSEQYQSVTISADWEYASEACRSFVQLLLGHGYSPEQVSGFVHKAKADFEAGGNSITVATESGFTITLSKLGHPTER